MRGLLHRARQMGVSVHIAHLPEGFGGGWYPDRQRIVLDFGLTPAEQRSMLAHELGHAYYGHDCDSDENERQAETYAAQLLIHPDDYAEVERIHPHVYDIAEALGVTEDIVAAFQSTLTPMRGVTYTAPKMGARQYRYQGARA